MTQRWSRGFAACMLSVFLVVFFAGSADAWWDGKWKYRKKVVLDTTAQGGDIKEAVADFPLLVRLHSGNFTVANAKNDGSDVRFVAADDKTPLKYHIERYDPAEEMVLVWVKVPSVPAAGQDFIWLYYGNGAAADGQDTGGTYDTSQLAVYHFGEKEGAPQDATAYKNHSKAFTGKQGAAAAIGRGVALKDGEHLAIAKSPSLSFAKGFTFSAWVRMDRAQTGGRLFSWDDGKQSVVISVDGTKLRCEISGRTRTASTPVDLPVAKWVHVAVTAEGGKELAIYTDGRQRTTGKLNAALPEPAADISIGASTDGKHAFAGTLDEVGIAGVSRSAAWVRAAAVSQGPETPLLSYLEEESTSGGGESLTIHLLVVTAKAITLDGWLVIGLIVAMIGVTWVVFFNKFTLLRKTKKSNAAFYEAFSRSNTVGAIKEQGDEFGDSSMFRICGAGLAELERRLHKAVGADAERVPAAKMMVAFRAALDKAVLQESKKNASGLLFFTLSISGGPFMGLFGTVWGVINTFAGVAEAGEANLAAIAPGVASALACTLMGLTLAIPALFQYSFLAAEIKSMMADVNVFTDELATRVDEEYGEGCDG